ncbi:MAG: cobalamin biosynthesis protein [Deltaproteobacteria bacterium]|nr:cobalamin biosynthesis protein [Deltaproteobacteria bacterium]MBW2137390.1 cobalamin biosynthesis protein [Deltaproteobacteria bacterium]
MSPGRTAIYAFTRKGATLGRRICEALRGDLFLPRRLAEDFDAIPFSAVAPLVQSRFGDYGAHVFIGATGIAVRTIGRLIRSKVTDPAVVVVDQEGRYVISLLSGHLGGGNDLARRIAGITGGEAVITTATDQEGLPSIDVLALERGLSIGNTDGIKHVNAALLEGGPIQVFDPEDRMGLRRGIPAIEVVEVVREGDWRPGIPGLWVTWKEKVPIAKQLVLHPRCLVVGLGCNRGTTAREIYRVIRELFGSEGLGLGSILCLSTIDLKRDEEGLLEAASSLGTEIRFFPAEELDRVKVPNPSDMAKRYVGARSVCEAAAITGAGGGELIVPKRISGNVALAVAVAP